MGFFLSFLKYALYITERRLSEKHSYVLQFRFNYSVVFNRRHQLKDFYGRVFIIGLQRIYKKKILGLIYI